MTIPDANLPRRIALMRLRNEAIARRDWAEMDAITRKLAKIDPPKVRA